jgi:tetratricopeptide (TPR) repeat protein
MVDDIAKARELEGRASKAQREGRYADADAPLEEPIAIWTRLRGPDDVEVLNDQMNLAVAYRCHGEAARGIPLLERVVALLPRSPDPDVPALTITARNDLATAYRSAGHLSRARQVWETCLAAMDSVHGSAPHPERGRVLENLAVVLRDLRDFQASESYARRGLSEWRALRGENDLDTAASKSALGAALLEQGKLDEAQLVLDDAMRTIESTGHELAVATTLTLVGALAARRGDRERARDSFRRALALTRKFYPDTHPEVVELLRSLAVLGA